MAINTKKYIEQNLYIKTKDANLVNLKLNNAQQIIYEAILKQYSKGNGIRLVILKARQQGASTLIGGVLFKQTATGFNINSAVVAHDQESTSRLFAMHKLFYEQLPQYLKPSIRANNAQILEFDNKDGTGLKSYMRCLTAGTSGAGRGATIQKLHLSEFAFWSGNKWDTYSGLVQAVPNTADSMIVVESTANGYNEFEELWTATVNGKNNFVPVFIPWYALPEYSMSAKGIEFTAEEREHQQIHSLTDDQLAWRKWCIANNCGGDLNKFRQEYPATQQEAFISTGECFFNMDDIMQRKNELENYKPIRLGYFTYDKYVSMYGDVQISNIRFINDVSGYINIHKDSINGVGYVIGADIAGSGKDSFAAQVINNATLEQVATLNKQIMDDDEFAEQLYCLGEYYNAALISPEINYNPYIVQLLDKMNYEKIYIRENGADSKYKRYSDKFGFNTTSATRPVILSELKVIFKENPKLINCKNTLEEMRVFIINNNKKPEAMPGKHDDLVMALAIAYGTRHQQAASFGGMADY